MDAGVAAAVSLGWLWFDNDPKTNLDEKVVQASARFRQKFGRPPDVCYVSLRSVGERPLASGHIQVRTARNVPPGHFLFVVEEQVGG
jgi:hypothetical protein